MKPLNGIWGLWLVVMKVRKWTVGLLVNWRLTLNRSQQQPQFPVISERVMIHTS